MNAQPDPADAALATVDDYRSLWPPLVAVSAAVAHMVACQYDATWYALARWRLQRRARRQVARGECSTIASLIAAGDFATLDALTDGWTTT
jgi:hypothetical protein